MKNHALALVLLLVCSIYFASHPAAPPAELREQSSAISQQRLQRMMHNVGAALAGTAESLGYLASQASTAVSQHLHATAPTDKLIAAIKSGDTTTVQQLLASGIHPNAIGSSGNTPLCTAIDEDNARMVLVLLVGGADPNQPDNLGYTPLMHAVSFGNPTYAQSRLRSLDLAIMNEQLAAKVPPGGKANAEIVRLLLHGGADPQKHDLYGLSSYMHAIVNSEASILQLLFDTDTRSNTKFSVLQELLSNKKIIVIINSETLRVVVQSLTSSKLEENLLKRLILSLDDIFYRSDLMHFLLTSMSYNEDFVLKETRHKNCLVSCTLPHEDTQHTVAQTVLSALLFGKVNVICTAKLFEQMLDYIPYIKNLLLTRQWQLLQSSNESHNLCLIVPEQTTLTTDVKTIHEQQKLAITEHIQKKYGFLGLDYIEPASLDAWRRQIFTHLSVAQPEQVVREFRAMVDEHSSERPTRFILIGHGYTNLIAQLTPATFQYFLDKLGELGVEFVHINSCFTGGSNLLLLQKNIQMAVAQHKKVELFNLGKPEAPRQPSMSYTTVPSKHFDGYLSIQATSDILLTTGHFYFNIGQFFNTMNESFERHRGILDAQDITAIFKALQRPISYQAASKLLGHQIMNTITRPAESSGLTSVRFPGTNTFFRAADLGEMEIITWLSLQRKRIQKALLPIIEKKMAAAGFRRDAAPSSSASTIEQSKAAATQSLASAASKIIRSGEEAASLQATATKAPEREPDLIEIPIARHIKYVQVFTTDLTDCIFHIQEGGEPTFISKIPGQAQHFIEAIEYKSTASTIEDALQDFIVKTFYNLYKHTRKSGLTTKVWFIHTLRLTTGGVDHTIKNLAVMIPSQANAQCPFLATNTLETIGQWFDDSRASDEALYEATAGQENNATANAAFVKFLQ